MLPVGAVVRLHGIRVEQENPNIDRRESSHLLHGVVEPLVAVRAKIRVEGNSLKPNPSASRSDGPFQGLGRFLLRSDLVNDVLHPLGRVVGGRVDIRDGCGEGALLDPDHVSAQILVGRHRREVPDHLEVTPQIGEEIVACAPE